MILRSWQISLVGFCLLVSACSSAGGPGQAQSSSSSSASEASSSQTPVTHNVTYTGRVEVLGISIYQQASHKLVLDDDRFILLTPSDQNIDLNRYVGQTVEVTGSVSPTVEGGGTIMSVEMVTLLAPQSSSAATGSLSVRKFCGGIAAIPCDAGLTCIDDPNDSCDPKAGGADCGGICVPSEAVNSSSAASAVMSAEASKALTASSSTSKQPASSASSARVVAASSSSSSSSVAAVSSSTPLDSNNPNDVERELRIVSMAKQNYAAGLWTQKYCTSHIGFCVPVHKNWFYTSFGSKVSSLWHVEFGMAAIENPGDGVIMLDLLGNPSTSAHGTDGQVTVSGSRVIGYRDWQGNHFEVVADARLKAAVEYMTSHIENYVPSE